MLTGRVNDIPQALLDVEVLGRDGLPYPVEVVLDTGFEGQLTLPSADLRQLELTRTGYVFVQPAVGEPERLMSYRGTIIWDGQPRPVRITDILILR